MGDATVGKGSEVRSMRDIGASLVGPGSKVEGIFVSLGLRASDLFFIVISDVLGAARGSRVLAEDDALAENRVVNRVELLSSG